MIAQEQPQGYLSELFTKVKTSYAAFSVKMLHARLMKERRPFKQKPVGSGWNAEIRPFGQLPSLSQHDPWLRGTEVSEVDPRERRSGRTPWNKHTHAHTRTQTACNSGHLCTASEQLTQVLLRLPQDIYWLILYSVLFSTHLNTL